MATRGAGIDYGQAVYISARGDINYQGVLLGMNSTGIKVGHVSVSSAGGPLAALPEPRIVFLPMSRVEVVQYIPNSPVL